MELNGKYTIGGRVLNRDGKSVDGIYIIDSYGLAYLCTNLEEKLQNNDRIIVLNDLETAQNYIRYLSRLYRYEFRERAKKLGVRTDEFRYYLTKLTDKKFENMDIGTISSTKVKRDNEREYSFHGDYNKVWLASIKPKNK